ncbi:MAG: MoaD/ThiS family protein [Chloroflexi bacterium]|nr:MoaD/ThiS family protein [Chloroflexota bacterium]
MSITLRVGGSLKRLAKPITFIDNARTVGEAVAHLDLPEEMGLVILVNGKLAHWDTPLSDGDEIQLTPVISGGRRIKESA